MIRAFEALLERQHIFLPPFLHFTPEEWAEKGHDYDEVRESALGWDVTDYGMGNFDQMGLALIILHNSGARRSKYVSTFAEKMMMIGEGQISPNHFHWNKMEDMRNRGGVDVVFRLWNAAPDESLASSDVEVFQSGRRYRTRAGVEILLKPGESLSLSPYCYHEFTVRPGTGPALLGEVSVGNDDRLDNRFYRQMDRFPSIEGDEPPYRLLCNEYPPAAK